jgi:hypothetical protein
MAAQRSRQPLPLGSIIQALTGQKEAGPGAPWPVWRNSVRKAVKWQPLSKKQAVRLWHKARRFERRSRTFGRQDGAVHREISSRTQRVFC